MGEYAPLNHEQQQALPSPERQELLPTLEQSMRIEKAAEEAHTLDSEKASVHVEAVAESGINNPFEKFAREEETKSQPANPQTINRELKSIGLRRELKHARETLSPADKLLSVAIHQDAVRVVSDAVGRTVSRPTGLLGGGIVAFAGTLIYTLMAHHIGLSYNYFVFILLFVAGYVIGTLVEVLFWAIRHRSIGT